MSKTGCKHECKTNEDNRIKCKRDNSIRKLGTGCKGEWCPNYELSWWRKLVKRTCGHCVYYEPTESKRVGKCRYPCRFYNYSNYVSKYSKSCPFWRG